MLLIHNTLYESYLTEFAEIIWYAFMLTVTIIYLLIISLDHVYL